MQFGLFGINFGACSDPEVAARVAGAAEQAGFDSLWTGDLGAALFAWDCIAGVPAFPTLDVL